MTRLSPSSSDLLFLIPDAFPTVIVSFSSPISNTMNTNINLWNEFESEKNEDQWDRLN
ncbi:hypothetical protein HanRHA438_Chr12g0538011 [Helianthus annuus]|nr:hypothetical protein HanIR_Chr12g0567461 [Helianthus annuus]KAJ0865203.1 hypothetical protein HanRHA438_Chr12g0538011 [Helianthus annuus]